MSHEKIRVAVAGLSFGSMFLPGFVNHARVAHVGLCDTNPDVLAETARQYGITRCHTSLEQVVASKDYDAVALFTPIPDHARQAVEVMRSGKHCACAVPMATSLEDIRAVIAARQATGMVYMMMETSLTTPEFFFVKELADNGEFGRIQFLRGRWYNNLENHPRYWHGIPPMHYTTHPVSPLLALAGTGVERVACIGMGSMRTELHAVYGNRWPVESAVFGLRGHDAGMEITSMVFETALQNKETFDIYGSRQSFVWGEFYSDDHALIRIHPALPGGPKSSPSTVMRFRPPSGTDRLPQELRYLGTWGAPLHLVHEFVSAVVEGRRSAVDVAESATYTAPGICAHESATRGGVPIDVPRFT